MDPEAAHILGGDRTSTAGGARQRLAQGRIRLFPRREPDEGVV